MSENSPQDKAATTEKPAPKPAQPKPVAKARMRKRHWGLVFSFILFVITPIGASGWYLYTQAADQYASRVGFSVRKEEVANPIDLLGVGSLGSSTSSDTDILYEFIQSQQMVEQIDAVVDLRALYSKPTTDPIFAFDPDLPIEDLIKYWRRMVKIYYDSGTGLIELRVLAFAAEDATRVAEAVFEQSSLMINELSDVSREDTTRYARQELDDAIQRLKQARQALTTFRNEKQIVDPTADVQGQITLLSSLQQQLAESLIELDLLLESAGQNDPRVNSLTKRVSAIETRISEERNKIGLSGEGSTAFAEVVAQYEELAVDREFAQSSYLSALSSLDTAQREARQKSRYLAAYLKPTHAQSAEFPQRAVLLAIISLFVFLVWSILALIYYSIKDRA